MKNRVSIKQVAEHAGVSVATVSLVLNGKGRISDETKKLVRKSVNELGYILNKSASRLRSGKSLLIGLVVNDISNPFFAELSADVEAQAAEDGYLSVMANTGDNLERQSQVIETMIGQGVAGLIISSATGANEESLQVIRDHGIPYVLAVRDIQDFTADFVGFDNYQAGVIAADLLVSRGHRKVMFVGGALDNENRRRRLDGVVDTIRRSGGEVIDPNGFHGGATRQFGYESASAIMAGSDRPDAIVCFNDNVAIGSYAALNEAGLVVGEDIAVIGFDNVPESASWMPPLTTVELFPRAIGARAAKALLNRIHGNDAPPERIYLAPRLFERKSA